jgi:phosphohistidine phosphatase
VWVLRHAKAAAHGPDDHGRRLTARGTRQATEVGSYLARAPLAGFPVPELVLCSSARRAVQTAELVMAQLVTPVELAVERRLYSADVDDVVEIVRAESGDVPSVMVVGHNPTLQELAFDLLEPDDDGRVRLEERFPTAALAVVAVPVASWARLTLGTGTLIELHTPGP